MKIIFSILLLQVCSVGPAFASLSNSYMAVANRSGSSVSLIDTITSELVKTIDSETLGYEFEPMYVSHLKSVGLFVVGDRKNSELMVFDHETGKLVLREPLSKGVFHQWANPRGDTVVVATDANKGADIVQFSRSPRGELVLNKKRFDIGEAYANAKPHDVVVGDKHFYLSAHDLSGVDVKVDRVFKVHLETLKMVGVSTFSPDVHLGLPTDSPYILVLEQKGVINFITRNNLKTVKTVENLPGAHGVYWNPDGTRVFAANIGSDGPDSVYEVKNQQRGVAKHAGTADSKFSKPHNIAVDFANHRLYLTHSGSNDTVSVYNTRDGLELLGHVQTGQNPFGIGLIQR